MNYKNLIFLFVLSFLLIFGCGEKDLSSQLQGKIDLRLKFEEGEITAYDVKQESEVISGLMGIKFSAPIKQEFGILNRVKKVEEDGTAHLVQKIDYFEQDSDALTELISQTMIEDIVNQNFSFTISPKGKISDVGESFNETMSRFTKNNFNYNTILEKTYEFFPKEPVGLGDQWTLENEMNIPTPSGEVNLQQDVAYQLIGIEPKNNHECIKILFEGDVLMDISVEEEMENISSTGKGNYKGEIYFSPKMGNIVYSKNNLNLEIFTSTGVTEAEKIQFKIELKNKTTMELREGE